MILFSDLTLQRAVLAERSERLRRDGDLARLRRRLRRRSRAGRAHVVRTRADSTPGAGPDTARCERAGEHGVVATITPPRHRAA